MGFEKERQIMTDKYDLSKISKIKDGIKSVLSPSEKIKPTEQLKEKNFYNEIDRKKNSSCCSLPMVIIILIFVFAGIVYALIYVKNLTKSGIDYVIENKKTSQSSLSESFEEKTKLILPGETTTINFSEVEVSNYLGVADSDFPLKKARIEINQEGIHISGKTSENIFSLPVSATVRPKIEDQKLSFVLDEIASGSISLPSKVKDNLGSYLEMQMRSRKLYDQNLEIVSASTSEDTLTIEVTRK